MTDEKPKLLLVYNDQNFMREGFTNNRVSVSTATHPKNNGEFAARHAIQIARRLGVPSGVCIYADLERWRVSTSWIAGWVDTMYSSEYYGCGGLYWNTSVRHVRNNWDQSVIHGVNTTNASNSSFNRVISEAAAGSFPPSNNSRRFYANIWSNRPYLNLVGQNRWRRSSGAARRNDLMFVPASFRPVRPPVDFFTSVGIWQYAANLPLGLGYGIVDYNLANDRGFSSMWRV